MLEAIIAGLGDLVVGFKLLFVNWQNLIMMFVGGGLLYLGIKKDCEPLLPPAAPEPADTVAHLLDSCPPWE